MQKNGSWGHTDEQTHLSSIEAGAGTKIMGAAGVNVDVGPSGLGQDPGLAWARALREDPDVKWNTLSETHEQWFAVQTTLTPKAEAVVRIAVQIATSAAGMPGVASTIASNWTVSMINNKGNLGRALKETYGKEGLKQIAKAYIMDMAVGPAPGAKAGFMAHLQHNVYRQTVSSSLDVAIHGQRPEDAFRNAAFNVVADTVAAKLCNRIGEAHKGESGALEYVGHKIAHAGAGAATGALRASAKRGATSEDIMNAAIAGGGAAALTEIIAEACEGWSKDRIGSRVNALKKQGGEISDDQYHQIVREETRVLRDVAQMTSALTAFGTGYDPNIAATASTDAFDNNFLPCLVAGGLIAWRIYCVVDNIKTAKQLYDHLNAGEYDEAVVLLRDLGISLVVGKAGVRLAGKYIPFEKLGAYLSKHPKIQKTVTEAQELFNQGFLKYEEWKGFLGKVTGTARAPVGAYGKATQAAQNAAAQQTPPSQHGGNNVASGSKPSTGKGPADAPGASGASKPGLPDGARSAAPGKQPLAESNVSGKSGSGANVGQHHYNDGYHGIPYSGFTGRQGFELSNPAFNIVRNSPCKHNGIHYTSHAVDQMQNRGVPLSVVDSIIKTGKPYITRTGTIGFEDTINRVRVIMNDSQDKVITVMRGVNKK